MLVVEDENDMRGQIVETLTEMGCNIIEAADGIQAAQILQSRRHLDLPTSAFRPKWPAARRRGA